MSATPDASDDPSAISVGDFYEDCSYQPRLCVLADHENDELAGISLITGDVGSCSPKHCGVVPLSKLRAIQIAMTWPPQHVIDHAREHDQPVAIPGQRVAPDIAQSYLDRVQTDPVQVYRLGRLPTE